jgi:hypothetical protein
VCCSFNDFFGRTFLATQRINCEDSAFCESKLLKEIEVNWVGSNFIAFFINLGVGYSYDLKNSVYDMDLIFEFTWAMAPQGQL